MVQVLIVTTVVSLSLLSQGLTSSTTAEARDGRALQRSIHVSLHLSRKSYPQNALVRTTVVVRNVSHHSVRVVQISPACGETNPRVEVVNPITGEAYPPIQDTWLAQSCGPPVPPRRLRPGQVLRRYIY